MLKSMSAGLIAAAPIVAPLPMLVPGAAAQTAKTASTTATQTKPKKAKRTPTPGQRAMQARMKKCSAEWKAAKAPGKIEKGMKWPQHWSACNKRLKQGG